MQSWFTGSKAVMQFWNTYYGVAHFVVTIGVFAHPLLEAAGRVPDLAQHDPDHDRPGDHRLLDVPADAAAPARRPAPA